MSASPSTIVLTGVSRGLGRALVKELVQRGHTVIGCARSGPLLAELRERYPAPHAFTVVDVAAAEQVEVWAQRVLEQHGPPDFLINNAAIINPNRPLWEVTRAEFDRVIDVNIKGVANTIRSFVPAMVAARKGVIVNLSSGWGRTTEAEVAPYCATKWAVEGLTQALAQELPEGMTAVPLNPGIIDTDMLRSSFAAGASRYPSPADWARRAAPFILGLGASDNGRPLSVPD